MKVNFYPWKGSSLIQKVKYSLCLTFHQHKNSPRLYSGATFRVSFVKFLIFYGNGFLFHFFN